MRAPDVNVLLHAYRADDPQHARCARWLRDAVEGVETLALIDSVVAGFVRIVTNPRIYDNAAPLSETLTFIDVLLQQPGVIRISAGPRHWDILSSLCRDAGARGNLVSDAAHAAVAVEHGATLVSLDRDFARFPGLRWELPAV
ncbi:MAG: PIN domain-containing protein [Microbacterium sp.]